MTSQQKPRMRLVLVDTSDKKPPNAWGKEKKQTLGPRRIFGNKREEETNDWFFIPREDTMSPFLFGCAVTEAFADSLKKHHLELCVDFKTFRKSLFSAICSCRYNGFARSGLPRTLPKPPKGWNSPTEEIWQDFLQWFCFNHEFWETFWHPFPKSIWEEGEHNLRNYVQSILPYYVKRDKELLLYNELIAVNSDGTFVDPLEAEYDEEEEHYSKWD